MILAQKLYLTADRKSVVDENDPKAAFLLGIPGQSVPDKLAKSLGLLVEPQAGEVVTRDPIQQERDPTPEIREQPRRRGRKS